jgi:3-oxoadipate enol-lactonase
VSEGEKLPRALLHVEKVGEGPKVVLSHGFGGSARNFRMLARGLQNQAEFVLYDARGHARSEAPPSPDAYTLDHLVSDLEQVIVSQSVGKVIVGGLSMGALTALELTRRRPDLVRALIVVSLPIDGSELRNWALAFADAIEARGLDSAGAEYVWGTERTLPEASAEWVRRGFLEHPAHALAALLRGTLARWPAANELEALCRSIAVPALFVAGERDSSAVAGARLLSGIVRGARAEVIRDAGHVVNLEAPGPFAALLGAFVRELLAETTEVSP